MITSLKECPNKPNCVSTQTAQSDKVMSPIAYPQKLTVDEVLTKIESLILKMPRTLLVQREKNTLHFTFQTLIMSYIDDVEFLIDESSHMIHFRSASRVGYSDLGLNRKRMTEISAKLQTELR